MFLSRYFYMHLENDWIDENGLYFSEYLKVGNGHVFGQICRISV